MKRSILSTILAAATLGLSNFAMPSRRAAPKPKRITRRAAGVKLMRRAEAGTLTMRHPGGVVSQTFRDMQQRNFLNRNV